MGYDSSSRLTTLTTDFHEFIGQVTKENQAVLQYGPFFQWDEKVRQDNPVPSGPRNPQALNRYSYVLNNPLRYVDPTGHAYGQIHFELTFNKPEDIWYLLALVRLQKETWTSRANLAGDVGSAGPSVFSTLVGGKILGAITTPIGIAVGKWVNQGAGGAGAADFGQLIETLEYLQVGSKLDVWITYGTNTAHTAQESLKVEFGFQDQAVNYRHMILGGDSWAGRGFANILNVFLTTEDVWKNSKTGQSIDLKVLKHFFYD